MLNESVFIFSEPFIWSAVAKTLKHHRWNRNLNQRGQVNWRKFGGILLPPYRSTGVWVVVIKVFFKIFFYYKWLFSQISFFQSEVKKELTVHNMVLRGIHLIFYIFRTGETSNPCSHFHCKFWWNMLLQRTTRRREFSARLCLTKEGC